MVYAYIKNTICTNIAAFDSSEQANAFKEVFMRDGLVDDLVLLEEGSQFGIGDIYKDGIWTKKEEPQENKAPSIESRLVMAEDMINFLLGL